MIKKKGVPHNVLNAVNHEAEASIIAQAGRLGTVTIATNMAGRGTDILLGGNPEFLSRSDMENEWMSRAAKLPFEGTKRYEDALRELREKYEEDMQRAEKRYREEGQTFEQQRSEALKKSTDIHRRLQGLSPFRELRREYEEVSTTELIDALHTLGGIPERYMEVKTNLETSVLESGGTDTSKVRHGFEEAREDLSKYLEQWQDSDGGRQNLMEVVDEKRRTFEELLDEYEFSVAKMILSEGEHTALVKEYEEARQAFDQAEVCCEEVRGPYEEAVREAQENYESKRQEYAQAVDKIREDLEKAPDSYRQRYGEILENFTKVSAEERVKVIKAGGVHIIGTERHESRRIDNQLRGRSGRQGDPGSSRFFLSLEDDLMRIFGADRIQKIMTRLGMEEGVPIEHGLVTRAIENAQKKVEAHNFDIRKHLLEYDDVMNKQREVIYQQRREVLKGENLKEEILAMAEGLAQDTCKRYADSQIPAVEWELNGLMESLHHRFNFRFQLKPEELEEMTPESLEEKVLDQVSKCYEAKEQNISPQLLRQLEKIIMLQTIDSLWKDHLLGMDHLKEGIGLRGYGQKNPLQEYQKEGFGMFEEMVQTIQEDMVQKLFTIEVAQEEALEEMEAQRRPKRMVLSHGEGDEGPARVTTVKREGGKVGRNDPCPCGSGKKYKRCHGR